MRTPFLVTICTMIWMACSDDPAKPVSKDASSRDSKPVKDKNSATADRPKPLPDIRFWETSVGKEGGTLRCSQWANWTCTEVSLPSDEIPFCGAECVAENKAVYRTYIIGDEEMVSSCYRGNAAPETCDYVTIDPQDPCDGCKKAFDKGCCAP